ncbi:hypothetical protein ACFFIF_09950 [Vagococcus entomophilus]|uniref:WxL domain-containing protein n=2 Tax=Vagococcus entomophilus TaxID=1160095 RepID=A0A430AG92_9ENTE|nr:hypothetical protein CBF30_06635 [Vagococcus entomophilus]
MKNKYVLMSGLLGIVLVGLVGGKQALADDTLNGNTAISAEVTAGDVTLDVDKNIDFGKKALADIVDFGSQDIGYTVTDYSGTTDGYSISAKLTDKDETRTVKLGDTVLSTDAAVVVKPTSNKVGENKDKVKAALSYEGVTSVKKFTSTIEWTLTKGRTEQIGE